MNQEAYVDLQASDLLRDVAKRLKMARMAQGSTIREIAGLSHCSESLLSLIENGKRFPSVQTLARLASTLNVSVAGLLEDDADRRSRVSDLDPEPWFVVGTWTESMNGLPDPASSSHAMRGGDGERSTPLA